MRDQQLDGFFDEFEKIALAPLVAAGLRAVPKMLNMASVASGVGSALKKSKPKLLGKIPVPGRPKLL